jgi:hypothetical protein
MNTFEIVSALDAEIARLQVAKSILQGIGATAKRGPGRPAKSQAPLDLLPTAKPSKSRTMSAAGRARIAAAQKARWAARKKSTETVVPTALGLSAKKRSAKKVKSASMRK